MGSFGLIVEFEVPPEHLERFNQLLAANAQASVRNEPGCRQFDVLHIEGEPTHVVLYEIYDSAAAFAEHVAAPHTKTFLGAAREMGAKQTTRRLTRAMAPSKT